MSPAQKVPAVGQREHVHAIIAGVGHIQFVVQEYRRLRAGEGGGGGLGLPSFAFRLLVSVDLRPPMPLVCRPQIWRSATWRWRRRAIDRRDRKSARGGSRCRGRRYPGCREEKYRRGAVHRDRENLGIGQHRTTGGLRRRNSHDAEADMPVVKGVAKTRHGSTRPSCSGRNRRYKVCPAYRRRWRRGSQLIQRQPAHAIGREVGLFGKEVELSDFQVRCGGEHIVRRDIFGGVAQNAVIRRVGQPEVACGIEGDRQ